MVIENSGLEGENSQELRNLKKGPFPPENPADMVDEDGPEDAKAKKIEIFMLDEKLTESNIWLLCGYPKIDNQICTKFLICKECKTIFSFGESGSTSGPKRHVEQKYPLSLQRIVGQAKGGQSTITSFATSVPKRLPDPRKKEINDALYRFLIENMLPAKVLSSSSLQNLINIPKLFEKVKEKVIGQLKHGEIDGIGFVGGLTFNEWRDPFRKVAYITITAHCLDDDFNLFAINLATKELTETNSLSVALKVKEVCAEFNIDPLNCLFITDSGANVKAACALQKWKRVACMGHDLNLLVQSDFLANHESAECKQFQNALSNCRDVVALFKRGKGQSKLEESRRASQLSPHSLKFDVSTRWNSALQMVSSVVVNYAMIIDILVSEKRHDLIVKLDINLLRSLLKFLKLFEDLTMKMSGDKYITMHSYWSAVENLKTYLNYQNGWQEQSREDPSYVPEFDVVKEIWLRHIEEEVGRKHDRLHVTDFHKLAALLDPRYKSLRMTESDDERKCLHNILKMECSKMMAIIAENEKSELTTSTNTGKKQIDQFMDLGEEESNEVIGFGEQAEEEVETYIRFKLNKFLNISKPDDNNFLQSFWCNEGKRFQHFVCLLENIYHLL